MRGLLSWALLGLLCLCAVAAAACSNESATEPAGESAAAAGQSDSVAQGASEPEAVASDVVGVSLIAAGGARTCALTVDQQVICWGGGERGSQNLRAPLASYRGDVGTIAKLAVGARDACALAEDGVLICWRHSGDESSSLGRPAAWRGSFIDISVGATHICGIQSDRTLYCRLTGNEDNVAPALDRQFVSVAAGDGLTCALDVGGAVLCWDLDGSAAMQPPAGVFTAISVGMAHACAVADDQQVHCWGSNDNGQAEPLRDRYAAVSVGSAHSCALTASSRVRCWGDLLDRRTTPPPGEFRSLSSADQHVCAVRANDTAVCWGYHGEGTFWGLSRMAFPQGKWIDVDAYTDWSAAWFCALGEHGDVTCHTAGHGIPNSALAGGWNRLALLDGAVYLVDTSGHITGFGVGVGRLGFRRDSDDRRARLFATDRAWGERYFCTLRFPQEVRCGQQGEPVTPVPLPSVTYIAISIDPSPADCWVEHGDDGRSEGCSIPPSCALAENGDVACWGDPGRLWEPPAGPFTAIDVARFHACGLRPSGVVACWGSEGLQATLDGEFTDIAVAGNFSCGVRRDGAIVCQSYNTDWGRTWPGEHSVLIPGIRLAIERYERPAAP